ncbi:peptidoglycan bridge formation glycyltransferase FemA/FemB family protein [Candidatus Dojkabacteria bacterium]|nr:peptidoglycan bridge formation glycyltransferase FemA/FemB family protein [Candidatus Dojkabacteria bacterium]
MYKISRISTEEEWEKFIFKHASFENGSTSPASFIQSWNWGEFLVKQGQKTYRLGIYEVSKSNNKENLVGVALGTKIEAKRGKYLHFRHGPVIDWENETLVKFILDELKAMAREEEVWFVRISPLIKKMGSSLNSNSISSPTHDVDSEKTWVLDLNKSEKTLLSEMRKNTRYSIRKANKEGVKIFQTQDSKHLKAFWKILQDTVKRQDWHAYSFDYIKDEFETFVNEDQNALFLAEYKGNYIAAAIFNFYNGQSVYHHSGSLTEYRKIPASYLIQWEAIKEAKKRGMKKHNFWGLPLDENDKLRQNHPWTGLGLFKTGFGGQAERWVHARDIPVSWKYWLTNTYERIEKRRRGYK